MAKKHNSQAMIETILSVSAKLFLEKGFDRTSMQDIANTAGISKGAIYHHFPSKEEMIKAITQKQEQAIKNSMDTWLSETCSMSGKEKLQYILEKNLESQEAHYLDDVLRARMKNEKFVISYMQDCVNKNAFFVSEIIEQGIADGSLMTEFPEECAEAFLLLINVWCDPIVFDCTFEKLTQRLRFLQHTMKSIGIDILSDTLLNKTLDLLKKSQERESRTGE